MSLRRMAPVLMTRCNLRAPVVVVRVVARRGLSTSPKEASVNSKETEAALEKANESMKAYYSYPPEKVIAAKKERFKRRMSDKQFYLQLGLSVSAIGVFLLSPFLGRRIAYDPEFKETYVPRWFHQFVPERPKNAWTKEELQQEIMMLQTKLHERAIAGDFTPEKLDVMRRTMNKKLPDKEEYAHFAQMHPGVDDDEDLEDE